MGVNVRLTPGLKTRVSDARRRAELPLVPASGLRTGREAELPMTPASGLRTGQEAEQSPASASGLRTGQGCRAATGTSLQAEDRKVMQSCREMTND